MIAAKLGPANTAIVAYGENYPDALSVAPIAAISGYPILLTKKDMMPTKVADIADRYAQKYVVGGQQVVSDTVMKKLGHAIRIGGKDRYETSVKIANEFGLPGESFAVATGEQFADALAGSVLAASNYMPILLVQPNDLTDGVREFIDDNNSFYFTILGGPNAVSEDVENELMSVSHDTGEKE
jgi:putative cell wall-binding protein